MEKNSLVLLSLTTGPKLAFLETLETGNCTADTLCIFKVKILRKALRERNHNRSMPLFLSPVSGDKDVGVTVCGTHVLTLLFKCI